MGYEGVCLDYLYVFLAWDLDIADLKQLVINSIQYSSVSEESKEKLMEFFRYKWSRFLDYIITKYWESFNQENKKLIARNKILKYVILK